MGAVHSARPASAWAFCDLGVEAPRLQAQTVRLVAHEWDSHRMATAVVATLVVQLLNYPVEVVHVQSGRASYDALASGRAHVDVEVWPMSHNAAHRDYAGSSSVAVLGETGYPGRTGLYATSATWNGSECSSWKWLQRPEVLAELPHDTQQRDDVSKPYVPRGLSCTARSGEGTHGSAGAGACPLLWHAGPEVDKGVVEGLVNGLGLDVAVAYLGDDLEDAVSAMADAGLPAVFYHYLPSRLLAGRSEADLQRITLPEAGREVHDCTEGLRPDDVEESEATCDFPAQRLLKVAFPEFSRLAPAAAALVSALELRSADAHQLLQALGEQLGQGGDGRNNVDSEGGDGYGTDIGAAELDAAAAACAWLRDNREAWAPWRDAVVTDATESDFAIGLVATLSLVLLALCGYSLLADYRRRRSLEDVARQRWRYTAQRVRSIKQLRSAVAARMHRSASPSPSRTPCCTPTPRTTPRTPGSRAASVVSALWGGAPLPPPSEASSMGARAHPQPIVGGPSKATAEGETEGRGGEKGGRLSEDLGPVVNSAVGSTAASPAPSPSTSALKMTASASVSGTKGGEGTVGAVRSAVRKCGAGGRRSRVETADVGAGWFDAQAPRASSGVSGDRSRSHAEQTDGDGSAGISATGGGTPPSNRHLRRAATDSATVVAQPGRLRSAGDADADLLPGAARESAAGSRGNAGRSRRLMVAGTRLASSLVLVAASLAVSVVYYRDREGWSVLNCIYFTVTMLTTVGYGDLVPSSADARAFTMAYAFCSMLVLGYALISFVALMLEAQAAANRQLYQASVRSIQRVRRRGEPMGTRRRGEGMGSLCVSQGCDTGAGEREGERESGASASFAGHSSPTGMVVRTPWGALLSLFVLSTPIVLCLALGLLLGVLAEGWSASDSLYFAVITVTTIGFGDLAPRTLLGRALACVYLPVSVGAVAKSVQDMGKFASMQWTLRRTSNIAKLLRSSRKDELSEPEFILHVVSTLYDVDDTMVATIKAQFRRLDRDGSGTVSLDDLYVPDEDAGGEGGPGGGPHAARVRGLSLRAVAARVLPVRRND